LQKFLPTNIFVHELDDPYGSVGTAVGKPIHKPKIDFYDPFSFYISDLYGTASEYFRFIKQYFKIPALKAAHRHLVIEISLHQSCIIIL